MGEVIVVTGANGFVGRACVAEARRQGLPVLALYRSMPVPGWETDTGITALHCDLTAPDAAETLATALPDSGAIIHAAAHLGDDPDALARDTLQATQTLLEARQTRDLRLVLISSLAVYDTDRLSPGDTLDEDSPVIPLSKADLATPAAYIRTTRDPYAGAKRLQEALVTRSGRPGDWILRPGAIWGPGRSWHALMGFWASKLHVTIGSGGDLPLTHVDHVAQNVLRAACTPVEAAPALNLFDDDRPTRARFLAAHRRCYGWPRLNVTVPYALWAAPLPLLRPVAHHLPGLFREEVLRSRMMPLRYPNVSLRSILGGEDMDSFESMMSRTREAEE